MRLDKFSNPIFDETDLFNHLYQGDEASLEKIKDLILETSANCSSLEEVLNFQFKRAELSNDNSLEEVDKLNQQNWFIPKEYHNFSIEQYCLDLCQSDLERLRVVEEMEAFRDHNMIPLLQWLKYFVDNCLTNNVLWGVGRGSSVASFVLYLLGVHQIDPIKYNLDWREFLR